MRSPVRIAITRGLGGIMVCAVVAELEGGSGAYRASAEGGVPGQSEAFEKMREVIAVVKVMTTTCEPWPKVPGSPFVCCGAATREAAR